MSNIPSSSEGAWHRPGQWWVSKWNYHEAVARAFNTSTEPLVVVDSTLRSICTSEPGAAVSPDDLVEVALQLDAVGVSESVFNISHTGSISDLAYRGAKACVAAGLKRMRITSGCGLLPDEWRSGLDKAMEAGVRHLEVSYGAMQLAGFSGTQQVYDLLDEAASYTTSQGNDLSIGFNVHRDTDLEFLLRFFELGARHEPRFFRLYDTKTCLGPHGMAWLIGTIRDRLGPDGPGIVVHTHNSWGLASATTIAGVLSGARGIDTAVLAVGTKSGHTPMEETVLALEALYGVPTGIDLAGLGRLANTVARVLKMPIHPSKPIVGANAVLCEQGPSVVEALEERISGKPALTPFAPATVGLAKHVVWGKNSLKPYVLSVKLRELGIEPTESNVAKAISQMWDRLSCLEGYPAWIDDDTANAIIRTAVGRES